MLFYNQIKREFSLSTWKRGQTHFLANQVAQIRLSGARAAAKVGDCDTSITIARGTVIHSVCSCLAGAASAGAAKEKHCEHAAALSIYIVERGSLLRAGLDGSIEEEEEDPEVKADPSKPKAAGSILKPQFKAPEREDAESAPKPVYIDASPVAYVRGMFEGKVLTAISVEPAIRYNDPNAAPEETETKTAKGKKKTKKTASDEEDTRPKSLSNDGKITRPLIYFSKQKEVRTWKTPSGDLLKLSHDSIPVLGSMESSKVIYQGRAALENLARLLTSIERKQLVFHPEIDLEVEAEPLKLKSIHIGKHQVKNRVISFIYEGGGIRFTSEDLAQFSNLGRLSDSWVWKDRKLLRIQPSLNQVYQFANRSGVAAMESGEQITNHTGFAYLHDDDEYPLHPLAAYRLSLELGVDHFTVDEEWKDFQEWKKNFERKKITKMPEVPYGFDLRDYQKNGVSWMWSLMDRGLSALLADDMGLGKTHQVIAILKCMYNGKENREKKPPSLVVAPTSVVAAWKQKLEKYDTGLKWVIFHGNSRKLPEQDVQIVLTTYGILQREEVLRTTKWYSVIMDEAQAIKNATTISSRAARTLKCHFRIAMTGTPIENQTSDLWSIMEFLLPGYLGSLPRFKRLYGSGREIPTADQAGALKRLVSPFLLRRTKEQVLTELPEKTEEVIYCDLTAAQKKAYREQLESSEAERLRADLASGGRVNYVNVLALLTRLKQICDHPRLPDISTGKVKKISILKPEESGKWETLDELLNEALRSNLKIVIFTQYLGVMDLIGHHLKTTGVQFTELRGDTQDRSARLHKFQTQDECKVFLCSLLAGGLGIDLTAGSVCIHFDRWWNPAKENQATDRLHRFGQTRGVQVFKLQMKNTVEDRIAQIIESKLQLSDTLIEESAATLKAFSREELLDLLRIPE
jgi:SNF2 family DNA or RNA helicase